MKGENYKLIFDNVNIAAAIFHVVLDENHNIQAAVIKECNEEYLKINEKAGLKRHQIIDHSYFDFMPNHDPKWNYYFYQAAIRRRNVAGEFRSREKNTWIRVSAGPAAEDSTCWMTFSDFTEYKNENDRLSKINRIDHLSGVKNRNAYQEDLMKLQQQETSVGVILADLNSLKEVNDHQGHQTGDYMIEKAANYLASILDNDLPYRIGGDEFVILLVGKSKEKTESLLHQIRSTTDISLSCGAAWSDHTSDINEIIKKADEDMYEDKKHYYQTHSRRAEDNRDPRISSDYRRAQNMPVEKVNRIVKGDLKTVASVSEKLPFGFLAVSDLENGGRILTANSRLYRFCGYNSFDEMMAFTEGKYENLIYPDDYQMIKAKVAEDQNGALLGHGHIFFRLMTKSGRLVNAEDYGTSIEDPVYGQVFLLYSTLDDQTENSNIYDRVTGLHEYHYLINSINEHRFYNEDDFSKGNWSVICFNLSDFHIFNDDFGLEQGDVFLVRFANLLKDIFGTELITRTYADHFAVFYDGDDVIEKVEQVHDQAIDLYPDAPIWIEAGIYLWENRETEEESFEQCVDYATEALKTIHSQRQYYMIYTDELSAKVKKKQYIQTHINEAASQKWLQIYVQPIVRSLTGKITSFEALSRWKDPVYGMISPAEFVPALEEKNLSYRLAEYVIDEVADLMGQYEKETGQKAIPVSINLSRRDFDAFDPFEKIQQALSRNHLDHEQIIIEITESAAMENPYLIRSIIDRFHQLGHQVWMDDFGSSYSSLNTLKDFDFDEIKLDMLFLDHLNERAKQIIISCIDMAKKLGVHTLCEGVETCAQKDFLISIGCEQFQGFYYSRPDSVKNMYALIREKGVQFESPEERTLFNACASVRFRQNEAWLLSFTQGKDIQVLYANKKVMAQMDKWGVSDFQNVQLSSAKTPILAKLCMVIRRTIISGQEEYITFFENGIYYLFKASRLSENNDHAICKITIIDATKQSAQLKLANATPLTQSLISMYDSIYYIDYENMMLEVVSSDFIYENVGTRIPFDPFLSERLIYEEDQQKFLEWISQKRLNDYFSDPHHRFDHKAFLIRDTFHNGQAMTKVFTIVPTDHLNGHYLLCLSDPL